MRKIILRILTNSVLMGGADCQLATGLTTCNLYFSKPHVVLGTVYIKLLKFNYSKIGRTLFDYLIQNCLVIFLRVWTAFVCE